MLYRKASILIHLDFLSILKKELVKNRNRYSFNPYSPGFSIYLAINFNNSETIELLQSLFTWIFYLF